MEAAVNCCFESSRCSKLYYKKYYEAQLSGSPVVTIAKDATQNSCTSHSRTWIPRMTSCICLCSSTCNAKAYDAQVTAKRWHEERQFRQFQASERMLFTIVLYDIKDIIFICSKPRSCRECGQSFTGHQNVSSTLNSSFKLYCIVCTLYGMLDKVGHQSSQSLQ